MSSYARPCVKCRASVAREGRSLAGARSRVSRPGRGSVRAPGAAPPIVSLIGVYPFFRMNQLIVAYHVRAATAPITLGDELADYKRVPPEKLKPWSLGTGLAVRDWLATRQSA